MPEDPDTHKLRLRFLELIYQVDCAPPEEKAGARQRLISEAKVVASGCGLSAQQIIDNLRANYYRDFQRRRKLEDRACV